VPSLRDLKRRITSVKKTRQITRAMRMVAAAKLRRAQDRIFRARPYASRMAATLRDVVSASTDLEHPLLIPRDPVKVVELIVISSDRGLAGAFSANVNKHAQRLLALRERELQQAVLHLVGRKAIEFFRRRRPQQVRIASIFGEPSYDRAALIAKEVADRYVAGEIDEAILVYSEFVSALSQVPRDVRLLPFVPEKAEGEVVPFSAEPDLGKLLSALVPKTLEVAIYRAMLESQAGEHAARMTAMEAATRNTEDMIGSLTLRYNRARQAAITRELVEIITGAEAL